MRCWLYKLFALFMLMVLCLNATANEKIVTLYGMFETEINSDKEYKNPFDYTEVAFNAKFVSPGGKTFSVSSFYDGQDFAGIDVWKIRFMPHESGRWKYRVSNDVGNAVQNGEFRVTDDVAHAANHGHVKVDIENNRYLIHDDGTPHFWIGGKWISARDYGPESKSGQLNKGFDKRVSLGYGYKTNQQLINYLDQMTKYKHNGILLKIALLPLENDRISWDLDWIQRGDWLVQEALKRGIYVQINMFDTWSRGKDYYFKYNMKGSDQLFDIWTDGDDKYKKNYLRYIVSRFSAYANVYWELGNEMEHTNCGSCFVQLANEKYLPWIRQFDPYQLPIGLSENIWRKTTADIGFLHQANILPDESMDRPVIMNELVRYDFEPSLLQKIWRKLLSKPLPRGLWHDDAMNDKALRFTFRRTFWKVFTHGGSGSSEATWLDIENSLTANALNVMRDHMHLSNLIQDIFPQLNQMMPIQNFIISLNDNEQISTRGNNSIYVSYFDVGHNNKVASGTVSLSALIGGYKATWLNPSTGKVVSEVNNTLDSQQIIMRPFYNEDIVLLLKKL